jgi:hypothetical protein
LGGHTAATEITPCPDCGRASSERYDDAGRCFECWGVHWEKNHQEEMAAARAELTDSPAAPVRQREPEAGGAFVLDIADDVPAIWGSGDDVLWASGEPLTICGPQGVGKTTLAQQLALARAGVLDAEFPACRSKPTTGGCCKSPQTAQRRPHGRCAAWSTSPSATSSIRDCSRGVGRCRSRSSTNPAGSPIG